MGHSLQQAVHPYDHVLQVEGLGDVVVDSQMGKAKFTIIGAMAELERDLISERVRAGMAAASAAADTPLSVRAIAKEVGVGHSTAGKIIKEVRYR
jgi:DNA invertase Pin-like site-specific DNA recombinase